MMSHGYESSAQGCPSWTQGHPVGYNATCVFMATADTEFFNPDEVIQFPHVYKPDPQYDPATSVFNCTKPGLYQFSLHLLFHNASSKTRISVYQRASRVLNYNTGGHHELTSTYTNFLPVDTGSETFDDQTYPGCTSVQLDLEVGDRVYVEARRNVDILSGFDSCFQAELLTIA